MGQWTWLFTKFPLADIELTGPPIDPKIANVLVRTVRLYDDESGRYAQVRVAPHNTAPFRGGPWLHTFAVEELSQPGPALETFREALAHEIAKCRGIG